MRRIAFLFPLVGCAASAVAGPYTTPGIGGTDARLVEFATGVSNLTRGPQNLANPAGGLASYGAASDAIGSPSANPGVVSLGDGGMITLTFDRPIANGSGADLAVFENAFTVGANVFAELGYVEVSTDGLIFARFPSVSLTQTATQVGGFGTIDPTDVYNLAGKDVTGVGTLFDLSTLANVPATVDVNDIRYVRVVDVVGSIDPLYARTDSQGHVINDPFTTPYASSGFDLDAVGVLNVASVPEPTTLAAALAASLSLARRRRVR